MASTINALTSGGGLAVSGDTSGSLQLQTNNGTTAMTIDTSQKVGVGTTSPASKLHVSSGNSTNFAVNGSTKGVRFDFDSTQTSIVGVDNTFFATYQPLFIGGSYLAFGNGITERMRIDSSGNVVINKTGSEWAQFEVASSAQVTAFKFTGTSGTSRFLNASGGTVGSITWTSTATSYNTSSDYRLKENIAPMQNALGVVAQLKPVTYTWKADGSDGQGFIAHELQEIVPDCVTGEKDAVDAEGKPVYQGIDTSFLVATLTSAIQEQQAIITDLKARIETLEGAKA